MGEIGHVEDIPERHPERVNGRALDPLARMEGKMQRDRRVAFADLDLGVVMLEDQAELPDQVGLEQVRRRDRRLVHARAMEKPIGQVGIDALEAFRFHPDFGIAGADAADRHLALDQPEQVFADQCRVVLVDFRHIVPGRFGRSEASGREGGRGQFHSCHVSFGCFHSGRVPAILANAQPLVEFRVHWLASFRGKVQRVSAPALPGDDDARRQHARA